MREYTGRNRRRLASDHQLPINNHDYNHDYKHDRSSSHVDHEHINDHNDHNDDNHDDYNNAA